MIHFKKPKNVFVACLVTLIAAALIIILVLFSIRNSHKREAPYFYKPAKDSFFLKKAPLSGPVKLLMGDTIIYPENMKVGRSIIRGSVIIFKPSERRLQFVHPRKNEPDATYFELIVPFDKKYRLLLPDSTEIVIQGGSSLRFPRTFGTLERKIELNGCAFFNTFHDDPRPFIVKTWRLTNTTRASRLAIQDYLNEPDPIVEVQSGMSDVISDTNVYRIMPGQYAVIRRDGYLAEDSVKPTDNLFWKDEYFEFNGLNMRQGLTKIADAYRMHIIFKGQIREGPFGSGLIETDLPLRDLLKDLELPDLHFEVRMRDSTIVVKGK